MANQIVKKFISDEAIDGIKLKLLSGQKVRIDDGAGNSVDLLEFISDKAAGPQGVFASEQFAQNYTDQRIAELVDSAPELLDTLNELAKSLGDDPNFASTITEQIANVQANVSAEEAARIAADSDLQANIDAESSARSSADQVLQENIDAEASARSAADTTLQSNIDSEESARIAQDGVLDAKIDQEIADRGAADTTLQGNIDAEATARASADTTLQANIDAEESARVAKDTELDGRISQEITDRESGDASLQANIDAESAARDASDRAIQEKIEEEVESRKAADDAAQELSDARELERIEKDNELDTKISEESVARSSGDEFLQGQIDQINSVSFGKEKRVLTVNDLSSVTLTRQVKDNSLRVTVGRLLAHEGDDYSLSVVDSKTVVTFLGSLAAGGLEALVAGDQVHFHYRF